MAKILVDGFDQEIRLHQRLRVLVYPSGVNVSSSALRFLSAKLRQRRRELGTRSRRLSTGRQALLTFAHLRNGHPYAQLAAGFEIGTATAYRYVPVYLSCRHDPTPHVPTDHTSCCCSSLCQTGLVSLPPSSKEIANHFETCR